MYRPSLCLFTICMVCMAFLNGCGQDKDTGTDSEIAATKLTAVTLRIHAWEGYAKPYAERFQQAMRSEGYEVHLDISAAEGLESFRKALRSHKADLISPANDITTTFISEKLVQQLDTKAIPRLAEINPSIQDKLTDSLSTETIAYIAPFTFGPYALAYNSNKMDAPSSYAVLWDKKYRGRVSISGSYDTANIYMTAMMLGIAKADLFNLSDAQLEQIEQELRRLHTEQEPIYWDSNLRPEDADHVDVATDWGVGVHMINTKAGENGAGWKLIIPNEGAAAWVDNWMIGAHVTGDELMVAHKFIDFMLKPDVQAAVARQTTYGVVNMYSIRHLSAAEVVAYHLTDRDYLSRLTLWQPLQPETLARYQALWERVRR